MPLAARRIEAVLAPALGSALADDPPAVRSLDPVPEKAWDGHSGEDLEWLRQKYHADQGIRRDRDYGTR